MGGYFVLGGVIGILLGAGVALAVTANILYKSNDLGDSKGTIFDFSKKGVNMLYSKDRVKKHIFVPVVDPTPTTEAAIAEERNRIHENRLKIDSSSKGFF